MSGRAAAWRRRSAAQTGAFVGWALALAGCVNQPAFAQGRPNTTRMQCRAAAALVSGRGAVVLSTGLNTYDRYVRGDGFCLSDEVTQPAFVPTADNPQCFIGYYCLSRPFGGFR